MRLKLAEGGAASVPDRGDPREALPLLSWVFQSFRAVHPVVVAGTKRRYVHGLGEEGKHALGFFGRECRRYYLLT